MMTYKLKRIMGFPREIKNFIKNILTFKKFLWNYRWYSANYGMHYFLEDYLKDIVRWYQRDVCSSVGHVERANEAQRALSILTILNEEYYYVPDCEHDIEFGEPDGSGFRELILPDCNCIPDGAYEDNHKKMNKHREEFFKLIKDKYMDWWD